LLPVVAAVAEIMVPHTVVAVVEPEDFFLVLLRLA
jgi:hypothetical protein